jgi:hypothetical protein
MGPIKPVKIDVSWKKLEKGEKIVNDLPMATQDGLSVSQTRYLRPISIASDEKTEGRRSTY